VQEDREKFFHGGNDTEQDKQQETNGRTAGLGDVKYRRDNLAQVLAGSFHNTEEAGNMMYGCSILH
jgi:hypothetical protein